VRGNLVSLPTCKLFTAGRSIEDHAASLTFILALNMSTATHNSCGWCDSQVVGPIHIEPETMTTDSVDERYKRQLFHDACTGCDDILLSDDVTLCNRCKHLRIPHILGCVSELELFDFICLSYVFDLSHDQRETCSFCLFVASCAEQLYQSSPLFMGNDAGVFVAMEPFRDGLKDQHKFKIFEKPDETGQESILKNPDMKTESLFYRLYSKEDPQHIQPYLNWSWVCDWITTIQKRQDYRDHKLLSMPSLPQKLQDVLVIDVIHGCVVDLPLGSKYLALSYVWGADSGNELKCTVANRKLLEQPGSLGDVSSTLPRTISDAILVCAKLNYQFLWVDRLCVMQDHPQISTQLNQMASIYFQAALTIISLEGDGATHGLPGVSSPRKADQPAFRYADSFGLVHRTPSIQTCRARSTWDRRGWTYQEYRTSPASLFFTESGLYLQYWPKDMCLGDAVAEGPMEDLIDMELDSSGLQSIQQYSERSLTYRSDKLRGMAGILQAMYEGQITFGIPLSEFECGIVWEIGDYSTVREPRVSDLFPTWSWASISEQVHFPEKQYGHHCSLAYWGWAEERKTAGRTFFQWRSIRDTEQAGASYENDYRWDWDLKSAVALAWLNRCFSPEVPSSLLLDCSASTWGQRVGYREAEPDRSFPTEVFQDDEQRQLFLDPDVSALSASGRIVANTQKSIFDVDWNSVTMHDINGQYGIIRTRYGGLAGSIFLDDPFTVRLKAQEEKNVQFIALAITHNLDCFDRYTRTEDIISVPTGIIYGCPCSNNKAEDQEYVHIPECDKSDSFKPVYSEEERSDWFSFRGNYGGNPLEELETHERAYFQHWRAMSFRDDAGSTLNGEYVPEIRVMMIAPGPSYSKDARVFRRLGIGKMFLKPWVESSPIFETIVLE
jgi:hypothetical protein